MNRELIVGATVCKPCTAIVRNLKSVIPAKLFQPHIPYAELNKEKQIGFGGPIYDKKGKEINFFASKRLFF